MQPHSLRQFKTLLVTSIRSDFAEQGKLVAPLLFVLCVFLLLSLGLEETALDPTQMVIIQVFLTVFLGLQLYLLRAFDMEQEESFQILRAYPIHPHAWYWAKVVQLFLYLLLLLLFSVLFALLFNALDLELKLLLPFLGIGALAIFGFTVLGVLLAAIVLTAKGREVLFPILFFPLSVPVLIAMMQGALQLFASDQPALQGWVAILCGFDIIYLTLGLILFTEIVIPHDHPSKRR